MSASDDADGLMQATPRHAKARRGEAGDDGAHEDADAPAVTASGRARRQVKRATMLDEYVLDGAPASTSAATVAAAGVGSTNNTPNRTARQRATANEALPASDHM
ncbi:hypothetical protein OIV83_005112 [Microbotryomycetes sp. JL201]|nr:hypothetical protein OIV83_005112 [Microbotryomycetes sp. JL201]